MKRQKIVTGILGCMGLLVLILDSRCAMAGGQAALDICIRTVIPSLFPFLFLTGMITDAFWGASGPILRFVGWLLNIPPNAQALIIPGFLGGYPAGAKAISDTLISGRINKSEAEKLLGFCNNAGPAFLFGLIAQQFPEIWMVWCLWGIHILSAGLISMLFPASLNSVDITTEKHSSVMQNLNGAVRTTGIICGWIIVFRIILGFMNHWFLWILPETIRIILWGFLELCNGCCMLSQIDNCAVRFVVCSGFLSFGGLCVTMQTASILPNLSMMGYIRKKLLQTAFSIVLAVCIIQGYGITAFAIAVGVMSFSKVHEKRSSIPTRSGV